MSRVPKRDIVSLPPAPSTRSIEVVTCSEERTCNIQIMFDTGFRISMPILAGDTGESLRGRMQGLIDQYRPDSGKSYQRVVRMVTKSMSESLCGTDGRVELIASHVAALIPRWELNLFWDFLDDLKIPVEYEDAMEVFEELGLKKSGPVGEHGGLGGRPDDPVGVETLGTLVGNDSLSSLGPDDAVRSGGPEVIPMIDQESLHSG